MSNEKTPHMCSSQNRFVPGCPELMVFSGTAHRDFAERLAGELGVTVSDMKVGRFADGEVNVKINESVRGKDVYLVQSTTPPVNESLMELLLMTSAMRHSSAKRVTLVVPYLGYMRSLTQSIAKTSKGDWNYSRNNLSAADVVQMMEVSGAMRVIAVDMYSPGQGMSEGFFKKAPVEHIRSSEAVLQSLVKELDLMNKIKNDDDLVVVAPHTNCLTQAKVVKEGLMKILGKQVGLATIIRTPIAHSGNNGLDSDGSGTNTSEEANNRIMNLSKRPTKAVNSMKIDLVGNVQGKHVLLAEQLIETGRTTVSAADAVMDAGATKVDVFACHCIFSKDAPDRIAQSKISSLITLDTVPMSQEQLDRLPIMKQISIAPEIAQLIAKMHFEQK